MSDSSSGSTRGDSITSNVTFAGPIAAGELGFTDRHGRTLSLRGVNVGGECKLPLPPPVPSGRPSGAAVSYTGRPFGDAAAAAAWWARLRSWGVGLVRLVVVWEALEPRALGVYDDAYIGYVHDVVAAAGRAGLRVFIDCHQDCVCLGPKCYGGVAVWAVWAVRVRG